MEIVNKRKSETEITQELQKLQNWLKQVIPDDWDKLDLRSEYSEALTYLENKNIIRDKIKCLYKNLKEQAEYAKVQQERIEKEKIAEAESEAEAYNMQVYTENKSLDTIYSKVIRGVNKLCEGYSNLLFVKGRGGIGKSFQIRKSLDMNKMEYVEVCGEVTEAYLYRLIFENNGKILWFKDVVKLLSSQGSINLLKAATETQDNRLLTKNNYSKDQDDLPNKFICKCKFVFDYNNLFGAQLKEDFEALITRGDYVELPFSDDDVKHILRLTATENWQKEVTEHIISCFESNGLVKLNLRTQWKAYKTYQYSQNRKLDWKEEIKQELSNIGKIRAMLYTLIGNKAVRTGELTRLLLRNELVTTIRTGQRRIEDWLEMEELHKISGEDKNFYVCINSKR